MKRKVADVDASESPTAKRTATEQHVTQNFRRDLFDAHTLDTYTKSYADSHPYKHGVIDNLIAPSLLRAVRDEIQTNISFTPKETDIYKIHQSGDLANLDGLDDSSLALLPSLITLRDSLYSPAFRSYLAHVTGSGPLSGQKTDMAVNVYTPGCHLLCHDDVIGSRRVSYILYLTDPDRPWRKEWGGALRLYPTVKRQDREGNMVKIPHHEHTMAIPPAFGQLSFFAVQPGESYHDVEEVFARQGKEDREEGQNDDDDGGRVRMAISGWYHIPQVGEEGYQEGAEQAQAERSSLAQLEGKSGVFDAPQQVWIDPEKHIRDSEDAAPTSKTEETADDEELELTEDDLTFLLRFMNPRYLTPDTVAELNENFVEESSLQIAMFLSDKYAAALRVHLQTLETPTKNATGLPSEEWQTAIPPYKHRYQYFQVVKPHSAEAPSKSEDFKKRDQITVLANDFFPSLPFRKWLSLVTSLSPSNCSVLARRFRRGMDYTLATAYEEDEPQLEVCLGITPSKGWSGAEEDVREIIEDATDAVTGAKEEVAGTDENNKCINGTNGTKGINGTMEDNAPDSTSQQPTDTANVGGYEIYMAGDDDDDDDDNEHDDADNSSNHGLTVPATVSSHTGAGQRRKADPAVYKQVGENEEDDGVLFSAPASWNMLTLVLRDQGTLRFVKYVSRAARGDRWDISGAWKVDGESDEDDDGDGKEAELKGTGDEQFRGIGEDL